LLEDEELVAVTVSVARYAVTRELLLTLDTGAGALEVTEGIVPRGWAVLDKDGLDTGDDKEAIGIDSNTRDIVSAY